MSCSIVWDCDVTSFIRLYCKLRVGKQEIYSHPHLCTSVGSRIYLISDEVAYRYTLYPQSFGDVFIIDLPKGTPNSLLNSKKSSYDFPTVRAAFTILSDTGKYQSTLGRFSSVFSGIFQFGNVRPYFDVLQNSSAQPWSWRVQWAEFRDILLFETRQSLTNWIPWAKIPRNLSSKASTKKDRQLNII